VRGGGSDLRETFDVRSGKVVPRSTRVGGYNMWVMVKRDGVGKRHDKLRRDDRAEERFEKSYESTLSVLTAEDRR
jgi:hypothetical protein